jgi:hypothetical protein
MSADSLMVTVKKLELRAENVHCYYSKYNKRTQEQENGRIENTYKEEQSME